MKHDHRHRHTMAHPHAFGREITVEHDHEHSHTGFIASNQTANSPYHRPHRHTAEQEADLRKQRG